MFAIAFDMDIKELRTTYGEPYNNAYYEIKILLRKYDFYNTQGSVYLTDKDDMANHYEHKRRNDNNHIIANKKPQPIGWGACYFFCSASFRSL